MTPVLYTSIRPAHGQTELEVIRRAHALGYELVAFSGWSDVEIGYPGNPGPAFHQARQNLARCIEIQDACEVDGDYPHIIQG